MTELHVPVLLEEILEFFTPIGGAGRSPLFVDATLGAGGHARALLENFPGSCLIGFDQDDSARKLAMERLADYGERVRVIPRNFREIATLMDDPVWGGADAILFDLGVSNMQLTTASRGFSYQEDGPLDMRMDPDAGGVSAADLLGGADIRTLTRIFKEYGEERYAFQIAKGIVRAREKGAMPRTTGELTALIRDILPAPVQRKMGTHPARRVFQAIRIEVNAELEVLKAGLAGAYGIAANGARIAVISYHSLEDRIVKRQFLEWANEERGSILTRRPIVSGEREIESNRSARSAKLRAFSVKKIVGGGNA